ncbi:hypothetical protein FA15DRAFT_386943 [Coprinopsis marcescibilis]|uniref:Uncharacterized protein n=1 Tax=Coprinopsis marcescibilis TaxID=230819 RepID=A0A5C3KW36_COPMA|nr:hypothetical protein FA15DRAFT_386943 [Coprinopsis marcescibilis]
MLRHRVAAQLVATPSLTFWTFHISFFQDFLTCYGRYLLISCNLANPSWKNDWNLYMDFLAPNMHVYPDDGVLPSLQSSICALGSGKAMENLELRPVLISS